FSNEGNWESLGSPAGYKAKTFVGNLTTYLKDDLGASDVTTTWVDATATGDTEVAVAGSIGILNLTHNIQARIDDGAKINQNLAYRGGTQTVEVTAHDVDQDVNFAGDIKLPSVGIHIKEWKIKPEAPGAGAGDDDVSDAAGFGFGWYEFNNTV